MAETSATPRMEAERRSKRLRGSPTGITPRQDEKKKKVSSSRRKLTFQADSSRDTSVYVPMSAWTTKETKALVEFMLLHDPEKWESTKDDKFWMSAAVFVRDRGEHPQVRTGDVYHNLIVYMYVPFVSA